MIPKIIHYVWLGGKKLPIETKDFIKTWKKNMPDFTIKCWNEKNFDCNSIPWVKQAIEHKMWAFAADYIRLYALYTEGGIYLDTDVEIRRPFNEFLKYSFFSSVEIHPDFNTKGLPKLDNNYRPKIEGEAIPSFGILSAVIGAEKNSPLIKDCLDYYIKRQFALPNGSLAVKIIIPDIIGIKAVKYGFRYINENQFLDNNIAIFNSHTFVGSIRDLDKTSYAVHYCEGSWRMYWWPRRKKAWYRITTFFKHLFGIKRQFNEHF